MPHLPKLTKRTHGTDGESGPLPGGLDLAKIFTPPPTTAPFGGLGQQIASFFEKLLNPDGAAKVCCVG